MILKAISHVALQTGVGEHFAISLFDSVLHDVILGIASTEQYLAQYLLKCAKTDSLNFGTNMIACRNIIEVAVQDIFNA